MKKTKRIISILLIAGIIMSLTVTAFAQEPDNASTGEINIISFNVDGLPVPSFLSSTGRKPIAATKLMAKQINAVDCDILSVQEDFNYHNTLKRNLEMKNSTKTSGGAGIGDGLNIFSKYPIYNVGRVAWETACGVFDKGSDELTPKGILYCTVEVDDGVYIDVYNIHADANEDTGSLQAKADQYEQLSKLIDEHSGDDRAVMITGDFNFNFALFKEAYNSGSYAVDLYTKVMDTFINKGFFDSWIEYNLDGNYNYNYRDLYIKYGCPYQRTWDTLDHVFYRSGSGVTLDVTNAFYDGFDTDEITWDGYLSDHAALRTTISYTLDTDNATKPDSLNKEGMVFFKNIFNVVKRVFIDLYLVIVNLPGLIAGGEIGWQK